MPAILSAAHAFPPHVVPQDLLKQAVAGFLAGRIPDVDGKRVGEIFDHSRIARRQFVMPADWYLVPRSPAERAAVFRDRGLELMERASASAMEKAGVAPDDIDHVIYATTTGISTPSLDALLIIALGMRPETTRVPVWGLGCAAGAAGIARACDYCLAHPRAHALLVALECCSLTFLPDDLSKRNLVAMSLFADGCAAVVVAGDEAAGDGPRIAATRSHLFPGTERVMGWDVTDRGFRLVLAPDLPEIVRRETAPLVDSLLRTRDLRRQDVAHYIVHPGGARVIDAVRAALGGADGALRLTEEVLRDHGNISSASVLVVLERWMDAGLARDGGHALLAAFGPGFSAEMSLLDSEAA